MPHLYNANCGDTEGYSGECAVVVDGDYGRQAATHCMCIEEECNHEEL